MFDHSIIFLIPCQKCSVAFHWNWLWQIADTFFSALWLQKWRNTWNKGKTKFALTYKRWFGLFHLEVVKNSTIQFFSKFLVLLYNCTIIILIGLEPAAYFEDSRDFVDKHDYSLICYPTISADYTVHSVKWAPLAKEREHLNGFEWCGRLVRLFLYFASTTKIYLHFTQ